LTYLHFLTLFHNYFHMLMQPVSLWILQGKISYVNHFWVPLFQQNSEYHRHLIRGDLRNYEIKL
jgi:hypothetical protein